MAKNRATDLDDYVGMLRFCAKYGVEVNKETIWRKVQEHDRLVATVRRRLQQHSVECESSRQKSFDFGPTTNWPYKGS